MRKLLLGLVAVGIATTAGLWAGNYRSCYGEPCCDPCPGWRCGSFEVGAQWIYLRPTSCDYDCAIQDDRAFTGSTSTDAIVAALPSGRVHGADPDYESGFRVSVGYVMDCSCYDVRVEYTYHHPSDRATLFGSETMGLWPTYMHPRYARNVPADPGFTGFETPIFTASIDSTEIPAIAHCNVKLDYDAVDIQFGSRSLKGCNLCLRTYAGLHFMNLDHRHEAQFNGVIASPVTDSSQLGLEGMFGEFDTHVRWNKKTWGVGPLFGLDAHYAVACGFGIGGHVGAAILAGETDGEYFERDNRDWVSPPPADVDNQEAHIRYQERNILFPYLRASLGINYLWCCDCFKVLVEVGYEFNSYINAIGHFRFNDERATGMANCYSYNLDGVYVSVRATI